MNEEIQERITKKGRLYQEEIKKIQEVVSSTQKLRNRLEWYDDVLSSERNASPQLQSLQWLLRAREMHSCYINLTTTLNLAKSLSNITSQIQQMKLYFEQNPTRYMKLIYQSIYNQILPQLKNIICTYHHHSDIVKNQETGYSNPHTADEKVKSFFSIIISSLIELNQNIVDHVYEIVLGRILSQIGRVVTNYTEDYANDEKKLRLASDMIRVIHHTELEYHSTWKFLFDKFTLGKQNLLKIETLKERIETLFESAIAHHVQMTFSSIIFRAADCNQSGISAVLGAASTVLADLMVISREIAPNLKQESENDDDESISTIILTLYQKQLDRYIFPQVSALFYQRTNRQSMTKDEDKHSLDIQVNDILTILGWMEHYLLQVTTFLPSNITVCDEVLVAIASLKESYLHEIQRQTKEWLGNILKREKEIITDHNGRLRTRDIDDILHILKMQLSVADEFLPSSYRPIVIHSFVQEVEYFTNQISDKLTNTMGLEEICSLINDMFFLSDKVESFRVEQDINESESIVQNSTTTSSKEQYNNYLDTVCTQLIQVAVNATRLVGENIVNDFGDEYLSEVGKSDWFLNDKIAQIVRGTMMDYFEDLQTWISDYFFSKCVGVSNDMIISIYLTSFLQNNRGLRVRDNREEVINALNRDKDIFLSFYDNFCDSNTAVEKRGNLERTISQIKDSLDVLSILAGLVMAENPEESKDDINFIISKVDDRKIKSITRMIESDDTSFDQGQLKNASSTNSISLRKERKDIDNNQNQMFSMPFLHSMKINTNACFESDNGGEKKSLGSSKQATNSESKNSTGRIIGLPVGFHQTWTFGTPKTKKIWKISSSGGQMSLEIKRRRASISAAAAAVKHKLRLDNES